MKVNQTGELPEVQWDRLLRIKTAGREIIPAPISTGIPMSPRPIPFWNAWLDPAGSGRGTCCWTMAAARDGSGFFCPARPAAAPFRVEYDPRIYEKVSGKPKCLCILWKILLCPGQCRTLCRSLLRRAGFTFFQPIFSGASPKGHGPDPKLILRASAVYTAVFYYPSDGSTLISDLCSRRWRFSTKFHAVTCFQEMIPGRPSCTL